MAVKWNVVSEAADQQLQRGNYSEAGAPKASTRESAIGAWGQTASGVATGNRKWAAQERDRLEGGQGMGRKDLASTLASAYDYVFKAKKREKNLAHQSDTKVPRWAPADAKALAEGFLALFGTELKIDGYFDDEWEQVDASKLLKALGDQALDSPALIDKTTTWVNTQVALTPDKTVGNTNMVDIPRADILQMAYFRVLEETKGQKKARNPQLQWSTLDSKEVAETFMGWFKLQGRTDEFFDNDYTVLKGAELMEALGDPAKGESALMGIIATLVYHPDFAKGELSDQNDKNPRLNALADEQEQSLEYLELAQNLSQLMHVDVRIMAVPTDLTNSTSTTPDNVAEVKDRTMFVDLNTMQITEDGKLKFVGNGNTYETAIEGALGPVTDPARFQGAHAPIEDPAKAAAARKGGQKCTQNITG